MKRVLFSAVAVAALMGASLSRAQDPVKVDPKHYSVVFENDAVRVLHIHYAVGEKSVMHSHPDSVAVFLEDQKAKMTHPDGKSEEMSGKKERQSLPRLARICRKTSAAVRSISYWWR